jgi:hypothetical protein
MPSRVLSLYTDDELVAKARHLRDQIDAGATEIANGLGANASYISVASARRIIDELMDELEARAGKKPRRRWNYTVIEPVSGYQMPAWPYRRRFS